MVIMTMNYIRIMFPLCNPIQYSDLKSQKTLSIVLITINKWSIQQTLNMYKKQIKTQFIGLFSKYPYRKSSKAKLSPSIINHLKLILLHKLSLICRHNYLSHMPKFILILWQSTHYIAQTTNFSNWITFRTKVYNLHNLR